MDNVPKVKLSQFVDDILYRRNYKNFNQKIFRNIRKLQQRGKVQNQLINPWNFYTPTTNTQRKRPWSYSCL